MFAELGVPTFDADEAVRHFYAGEGAAAIEAAFPGVVVSGQVDRERLGSRVLGDAEALRRLEGLVHPAVAQARSRVSQARRGRWTATGHRGRAVIVRDRRGSECRSRDRGERPGIYPARPCFGASGHDRGQARGHPFPPNAGCGEEASGSFRHRHARQLELTRAVVAQFVRSTAALTGGRTRHA